MLSELNRLRVLTINVWNRSGDWQRRRAALISGIRDVEPDIVAMQEVVLDDSYDQATDLLGPGYVIAQQQGRTEDGVGAAMAARWPIELHERTLHPTVRIRDTDGWIGSIAVGEVAVPSPVRAAPLRPSQANLAVRLRTRARAASGRRVALHRGSGRRPADPCGARRRFRCRARRCQRQVLDREAVA